MLMLITKRGLASGIHDRVFPTGGMGRVTPPAYLEIFSLSPAGTSRGRPLMVP